MIAPGEASAAERPDLGAARSRGHAVGATLVFHYATLALTLVNSIALVPLYLRYFDLGTYGAWLASGNVLSILSVLDLGVNLVLTQRLAVAAAAEDCARFARTTAAGIALSAISAALIVAGTWCAGPWIAALIRAPEGALDGVVLALRLAGLGAGAQVLQQAFTGVLQSWQEPYVGGWAYTLGGVLGIGASIACLVSGAGVASLGWAMAVRGGVALAICMVGVGVLWRRRRLPWAVATRSDMVTLGRAAMPLFASRVGGAVLSNSEAALVSSLVSPDAAAIVALTGRAFSVGGLVLTPIAASSFAAVARASVEEKREVVERYLARTLRVSAAIGGVLLGGALSVNASFVSAWVGKGKFGGLAMSIVLCLSVVLATRVNAAQTFLQALGKLTSTSWAALVELALRIPLILLLVGWLGPVGVPLATVGSSSLIGLTWMGTMLGRFFGTSSGRRLVVTGFGPFACLLALGVGCAALTGTGATWLGLGARIGLHGVIVLAACLVAMPDVRRGTLAFVKARISR